MMLLEIYSKGVEQTKQFGIALGQIAMPGDVLCVYGNLGTGKTALAQGVAQGLQVDDKVTSPTFILVQEYEGRLPFFHFDVYRLEGCLDFEMLGFEEYFTAEGVVLIEWADYIKQSLPVERLDIYISRQGETCRLLKLKPIGQRYQALVEELNQVEGFGH